MLAAPPRILALARTFAAEEAGSFLRHGLRNKLATIRNAGFFLRRKVESPDPRVAQMLELIESELASTEALLASRLPAPDPLAKCDVCTVARTLCAELSAQIVLPEPAVTPVRGAAGELELALFCLLENALEAAGARGGTVSVRCQRRADGHVALDVLDEGPGLAASEREVIEPFFTTRANGRGLGLPIARRIASRAGGNLELAARPEGGVRATLVLGGAGELGHDG